jgi:hypothetical protein
MAMSLVLMIEWEEMILMSIKLIEQCLILAGIAITILDLIYLAELTLKKSKD